MKYQRKAFKRKKRKRTKKGKGKRKKREINGAMKSRYFE
jgi:hypothetical protein